MADADPAVGTGLGLRPHDDRMPDFSPAAHQYRDDLAKAALADLDAMESAAGPDGWDVAERRVRHRWDWTTCDGSWPLSRSGSPLGRKPRHRKGRRGERSTLGLQHVPFGAAT